MPIEIPHHFSALDSLAVVPPVVSGQDFGRAQRPGAEQGQNHSHAGKRSREFRFHHLLSLIGGGVQWISLTISRKSLGSFPLQAL